MVFKTKARAGSIWAYIDPSKRTNEILQLVEPKMPKPSDVKANAISVTDLSEDEVRKLLQLQSIAKPEVKKYETGK